jgi:hypothetical protein
MLIFQCCVASFQIFAYGLSDVGERLLLSPALRPASRQARTRDAETLLGFFQRDLIFHSLFHLPTILLQLCLAS